MVTIERGKLEQVLDDLIFASSYCDTYGAITTIEEVLSQPAQEPVGFIEAKADNECADAYADGWNACVRAHKDTTPPKRPWVGLTDEEVLGCLGPEAVRIPPGWSKLTRAVEAKLKEKNFD